MRCRSCQQQRYVAGMESAFTLIEMLVVIGIIAVISVISLPSLRGLGQSNVITSATQQLVDDLMLARHKAIVNRTTVHVVFVPPWANVAPPASLGPAQFDREEKLWERLREGVYTTYALYAERSLGDQPGQKSDRYLTDWRVLPDGVFIGAHEYQDPITNSFDVLQPVDRPFGTNAIPYPTERSPARIMAPTISFDENGRFFVRDIGGTKARRHRDECVELATGSVLSSRNGSTVEVNAREIPPRNSESTNKYNRIRIHGMSGRARPERPEIQFGD